MGRAVNLPYIDLVEKISKKGDKEAIPVFMSYPLLPEYIENYIIMNGYLQDVKMSEKIPKKSKQGLYDMKPIIDMNVMKEIRDFL